MPLTSRRIALLLSLGLAATADARPRLVLLVVVDQLRADTLLAARKHFGRQGLERLFAEGATFGDARYQQAATDAVAGHAAIATGAYAYKNGIAAPRLFDRKSGRLLPVFFDAGHPVLGAHPTPDDDTSPTSLFGETLGDRVKVATDLRGKSVAVGLDDAPAVALAGRSGSAWWLSAETGHFATSTYYAKEPPAWVAAFNDKAPADALFGKAWDRAVKEAEYPGSDDRPFEADFAGLGRTFPHPVNAKLASPGPDFYAALGATPVGNDLVVAFARAAIDGEQLGRDADPDVLAVSLAASDRIGRVFGADSHEAFDAAIRLDKQVADLLGAATKAAGPGNVVVAFVGARGGAPLPEAMAALGFPSVRVAATAVRTAVDKELSTRFGAAPWVAAVDGPDVWINEKTVVDKKLSMATAQQLAGEGAQRVLGVAGFFTRAQLAEGAVPATPLGKAHQLSFLVERSPDVRLVLRPFCAWSDGDGSATPTRGSPYRYDTHVPMAIWGPGIRAGAYRQAAEPIDLAPTLAFLLGVGAPAESDGRILGEALK